MPEKRTRPDGERHPHKPQFPAQPLPLPSEEPWQRLDGENARWYNRFIIYRDLGPRRSIVSAYAQEWPNKRVDNGWFVAAKMLRWAERAAAWDEYDQRQKDRERAENRQKIALAAQERAQQLGQILGTGAGRLLMDLFNKDFKLEKGESPGHPVRRFNRQQFSFKDILEAARLGVELERQAAGLPANIEELRVGPAASRDIIREIEGAYADAISEAARLDPGSQGTTVPQDGGREPADPAESGEPGQGPPPAD